MIGNTAKRLYKNIRRKVRSFLLVPRSREFLTFLSFFIAASCFWILQTLDQEYETEVIIPIEITNVPSDTIITQNTTQEIRLLVKDKGTVLIKYALLHKFSPIKIKFENITDKNGVVRKKVIEYEKNFAEQLKATTRVVSFFPDTLSYIHTNKANSKKVPIKHMGEVTAAPQYYVNPPVFTPDSVTVYAPKDILDKIEYAQTQNVSLSEISDTTTVDADIYKTRGALFVPNKVKVMFPTDIYTEKSIEVPIKGINFPSNKTLRTFPPKATVTIKIGASRFKEVTDKDFTVEADYNELIRLKDDKFTPTVGISPKEIKIIRISPAVVDFLIEEK